MGTEAADLIIRTVQRSDPSYELNEMYLAVDGLLAFSSTEGSGLRDAQQFLPVPKVAAGNHTVAVSYVLHGKGTGDHAYLSGYRFVSKSAHTLTLAPAQTTCISILLYFDPDLALHPADRLRVDFREERAPLMR